MLAMGWDGKGAGFCLRAAGAGGAARADGVITKTKTQGRLL